MADRFTTLLEEPITKQDRFTGLLTGIEPEIRNGIPERPTPLISQGAYLTLQPALTGQMKIESILDTTGNLGRAIETYGAKADSVRAKITNSLFFAEYFEMPFKQAYEMHDSLAQKLWEVSDLAPQAISKLIIDAHRAEYAPPSLIAGKEPGFASRVFDKYIRSPIYDRTGLWGYKKIEPWQRGPFTALVLGREEWPELKDIKRKSYWDAVKDAWSQAGVRMAKGLAGRSQMAGDIAGSERLSQWGQMMAMACDTYYEEHSEERANIVPGTGFVGTTVQYIAHPENLLQATIETGPMLLSAVAGHITGTAIAEKVSWGFKFLPWIGRVAGISEPIVGEVYAEARAQGTPPHKALPQAYLTAYGEGFIEEWTLSQKIRIFKGMAGRTARRQIAETATDILLAGGKAYTRGVGEEYSQEVNRNFWQMVFTDPQPILDNFKARLTVGATEAAAAGGLMEMVLSGAFAISGKSVNTIQKKQRIKNIRQQINKNDSLSELDKVEINAVLDQAETTEAPITQPKPTPAKRTAAPEQVITPKEVIARPTEGVKPEKAAKPLVEKEVTGEKEPWQMTKVEVREHYKTLQADAKLTPEQFRDKYAEQYGEAYLKQYLYALQYRQKSIKEVIENTEKAGGVLVEHKKGIQKSIKQGKPVPPEVLAEYKGEKWADEAIAKIKPTPEAKPVYSKAGKMVDGRIVLKDVPNMDSISATLDDYEIIEGIQEVPMSEFELKGESYSATENKRITELVEEIKESGEITPLIVVQDKDGLYILEGGHRADALYKLGAKSLPAVIVKDLESLAKPTPEAKPVAEGKIAKPQKKAAALAKKVVLPYRHRTDFEHLLRGTDDKDLPPLVAEWKRRILGAAGKEPTYSTGQAYRTTMKPDMQRALTDWAKKQLKVHDTGKENFATLAAKGMLKWLGTIEAAKKPIIKKKFYTSVPEEWRQHPQLADWGQKKGIRTKGNYKIKGRKSFIWQTEFDQIPTRLPKTTMDAFRAKTDEIWSVTNRKQGVENYYLVPKRVVADVRAELGAKAFVRKPKPEPTARQILQYAIQSANIRGGIHQGEVIERALADEEVGLAEADLTDNQKRILEEYRKDYEQDRQKVLRDIQERTEKKVQAAEEELGERQAIQDEELAGEIGDFLDGLTEEGLEKPRQTDLLGREELRGGAAGKQTEFLSKEDYKTLKEREKIVAEKDLEGQQTFLKREKAGGRPEKTLGGMPEKPPGLTQAEVEHLGVRERRALRAGQKRGYPIGYKMGAREEMDKARTQIFKIRMAEKFTDDLREQAAALVKRYVPKEKQYRYTKRILAAKTSARVEKLTEAIDSYIDKEDKRLAVRDFKNFVKSVNRTYRRGEVKLGKLREDTRRAITDVLDKFDIAKLSDAKEKDLRSLENYVKRISGTVANAFESMEEEAINIMQMPNARIKELERLGKVHIGKLDADEIRYIQKSLEDLIAVNERKGQIKQAIRAEKLRDDINTSTKEIAQRKAVEPTEMLGAVKWIAVHGQSNLDTLSGLATGKDNASTKKLLDTGLYSGYKKKAGKLKEFVLYTRDQLKDIDFTTKELNNLEKLEKITIGGKAFYAHRNQIIAIYTHTQAEGNLRRLLKTKGLNFTVYKRHWEYGYFKAQHSIRTGKPTLSEIKVIISKITDKEKKLVEKYFEINREKQAPAINETSMAMQNFELAQHKKHFPVSREIERGVEGITPEISIAIDQQGRYLPRTGGNARINIVPFTREFINGLQSDATYYGMSEALQDARTLLSNKKYRQRMKASGQGRALKEMTTMLRRIQGLPTERMMVELMAAKGLGNIGKSILSLRISGGGVQICSIPAAWEIIEPKYFVGNIPTTPARIERLKKLSPVLWLRWEARQFDFVMGAIHAQNAFRSLLLESTPVTDKMLKQYTWGDMIAIDQIDQAAQRKIIAETKLKSGTKEFDQKTIELTELATRKSQPTWDMLSRSPLTSSPNVFWRGSVMFMSARNAQYNVVIRAIDDMRKGRISKAEGAKRLAGVGMASTLISLWRRLFKILTKSGIAGLLLLMGKMPEDELEPMMKQEAIKEIKKIPFEIPMNIIGLSAFGDIFTNIAYRALGRLKYGKYSRPVGEIRTGNVFSDIGLDLYQLGDHFVDIADYAIKGKNDKAKQSAKKAADVMAELIAYRFGLPYAGPKSDIYWPYKAVIKKQGKKAKTDTRRKPRKLNI